MPARAAAENDHQAPVQLVAGSHHRAGTPVPTDFEEFENGRGTELGRINGRVFGRVQAARPFAGYGGGGVANVGLFF